VNQQAIYLSSITVQ